jgi:structural maintenance of chromosome 2
VLTKSEELLQTLLTGVTSSSSGNTGGGYLGQIADARGRLTQAMTEEEQSRMKLGMSQNELKTLEAKWRDVERDAQDGQKRLDTIFAEVEKLRKQVMDSGWSEEAEQRSQQQLNDTRRECRNLTEVRKTTPQLPHCSPLLWQEWESKKQRVPSLGFDYDSPYPGFDRSKVKGLVASLISLKPSDYDKATALEITAGGRLYNVIVQDPQVGQDLIDKGHLRKRVTIIPLNGIRDRRLSTQVNCQRFKDRIHY